MAFADVVASGTPTAGDGIWPSLQGWAAEIGLAAPDALALVAEPAGGASAGKSNAEVAGPEAAS